MDSKVCAAKCEARSQQTPRSGKGSNVRAVSEANQRTPRSGKAFQVCAAKPANAQRFLSRLEARRVLWCAGRRRGCSPFHWSLAFRNRIFPGRLPGRGTSVLQSKTERRRHGGQQFCSRLHSAGQTRGKNPRRAGGKAAEPAFLRTGYGWNRAPRRRRGVPRPARLRPAEGSRKRNVLNVCNVSYISIHTITQLHISAAAGGQRLASPAHFAKKKGGRPG